MFIAGKFKKIFYYNNSNTNEKILWGKKLFEKIKTVYYGTNFFYDLFWTINSNEPKLKKIVNNYRKHLFVRRLFTQQKFFLFRPELKKWYRTTTQMY